MNYVCKSCGYEFDNPKKLYGQWLEHFGTPCREEYSGCPNCGNDYREIIKCSFCEQSVYGNYVKLDDSRCVCDNCFTICSTDD